MAKTHGQRWDKAATKEWLYRTVEHVDHPGSRFVVGSAVAKRLSGTNVVTVSLWLVLEQDVTVDIGWVDSRWCKLIHDPASPSRP